MIRFFNNKDIDKIIELGNTLYDDFDKSYNISDIPNDKYTKILVYELENTVIGFIMYTKIIDNIDILSIVVDVKHRNKRVASTLIDYIISEYNNEISTITLEVNVDNIPALNLYKKFGFEVVNTRKKYFNGKDSYLMVVKYK